ncbi:MAG TPA: pitrilysin family protein [Thermoanaerobaculia bacterium]|nr:pitrilysin family protein [Thermoanaerobaculia bacterium]
MRHEVRADLSARAENAAPGTSALPVFVVEDHTVPLFELTLALPIGDVLDPADRVGLASLTATLLRSGGAGERSAEQLDEEIAYLGVELDVIGGGFRSGIRLDGSPRVLEPALDLLADVLLRPRFDEDRLALLRRNLEASMRSRNDAPGQIASRNWAWLMWGHQHPLARQVLPGHLVAIDRDAVGAFHRRHWHAPGAVLAISGDVDTVAVLELLGRKLGPWIAAKDAAAFALPATPSPLPPPERAPPGVYWRELDTPRVEIVLGDAAYRRASWDDPDAFAIQVMSEIFDGPGAISRLRSRLRGQESLVYTAGASVGIGTLLEGLFEVRLGTTPENAVRAIALALEEIQRMRNQLPHPRELELGKRIHLDAFPLLFDSAEKISGRFAEDVLLGRPHSYWTTYRDRVQGVTLDRVLGAAQRTLHPDQLRLLWVGPPPPEDELRKLGFRVFTRLPLRDPFTLEVVGEAGSGRP